MLCEGNMTDWKPRFFVGRENMNNFNTCWIFTYVSIKKSQAPNILFLLELNSFNDNSEYVLRLIFFVG